MKTRWFLILLIFLLAACSGTGTASPEPTQTESSPVPQPTSQDTATEQAAPQPTATEPLPSLTVPPQAPPTHTYAPAPDYTQAPLPTYPDTILPNPAAIIAQVSGRPNSFQLVGGSQNGSWINAGDVAGVLSQNAEYQIHTADEFIGWVTGQSLVHELICNQYYVSTEPFSIDQSAVGIAADWPVTPRKPLEISPDQEVYLQAVAAWLVDQAPSQPIVAINRIWRVDLEGNGTEEVLINATRFAEPSGHNVEPRDYSVVLLRTVVGSDVATITLVGDYYAETAVNRFPLTYNLEFIGDLNGDGKMEVVIGVTRWEGSGVMVFEIDLDQVQLVLSVMCSL